MQIMRTRIVNLPDELKVLTDDALKDLLDQFTVPMHEVGNKEIEKAKKIAVKEVENEKLRLHSCIAHKLDKGDKDYLHKDFNPEKVEQDDFINCTELLKNINQFYFHPNKINEDTTSVGKRGQKFD